MQNNQLIKISTLDIREEEGSDSVTLMTRGTPLPVTLGKVAVKQKIFSHEDSRMLQNERHFTDNDMK